MKARVTGYKKVAGLLDDEIAKKPKRSARYEIDIPDMAGGIGARPPLTEIKKGHAGFGSAVPKTPKKKAAKEAKAHKRTKSAFEPPAGAF